MTVGSEMTLDLDALEVSVDPDPLVVNTSRIPPDDLVIEAVSLEPADIAELISGGPSRSYATVQHTRAYHHIAALKLAAGEKAGVVAASLNLKAATLSRLQKDPQFIDLVENYRGQFVDQAIDTFSLMKMVSAEAVTALHERLIGDERDSIPLEALRRIGETFADRTGHSPVRRSESLNVNASGHISDLGLERVKSRHGEDTRYYPQLSQPTQLEETHKAESESAGAAPSIAAIFESVEERPVISIPGKGPSV